MGRGFSFFSNSFRAPDTKKMRADEKEVIMLCHGEQENPMNTPTLNRRQFIKSTVVSATAVGFAAGSLIKAEDKPPSSNPLPRWRGFNLTDFNSPNPGGGRRGGTTDDDLKWIVDWGFDFIR